MVLKILNLNIPLSFSSLYLDSGPGFGMAVMVATFMPLLLNKVQHFTQGRL